MSLLTSVLLLLILLLCGGYAGMILMCQIGVLPALRRLHPSAYADAWRSMDLYMDRAMPPYKGSLLLLNAATVVLLAMQHRWPLTVATGLSLLCSVAGLVLTVRQQFPVNATLKALPADTPDSVLVDLREQTVRGFHPRFFLAVVSFLSLGLGVTFWPIR